ncbi:MULTISPECIES: TetR/AcrR family transcriptional regulator [unclassified Massilia]|uniref:TetR/AcrR family transcriptional regulator n=1 Tax=unclassified Massilia TaxID=2609279 RepID=UPI00177CA71A|nr:MULTISPECIES: TetR/AcrR family transcriptional regulator [unclassified Massilia]MBD8529146.1 TetR/AcrR family transcriptional regulator [Massilia sp. CFBP 13647]MBD8672540.1 TetR/AcrR family transcriptional regulator [Massilia sp. CFBP 13721]
MTKEIARPRGRPRKFDPDHATAVAQDLFHARGYDDVSVADVTDALGINTPSFYSAFGSKLGLYNRVIERYGANGAIPLADLLRADRPVVEGLRALLEDAARRYSADPAATGCIVLEGCGSSDEEARTAARAAHAAAEQVIFDYIARRHPEQAADVSAYVSTVMNGLSAKARMGQSQERLLASARLASLALAQALG